MFHDRLTGLPATSLPSALLLGRWQLDADARVNGVPAVWGDYLIPDEEGRCVWEATRSIGAGAFDAQAVPGEPTAAALQQLRTILEESAGTWQGWCAAPPVATDVSARLDLQELERALVEKFGHLREVCRRPRLYLEVRHERLHVGQVRRMAPRAAEFLAAHTEDWDHVRLRSVQPRRVLATVTEDRWDIYENRVAARLIDRLREYLRRRLDEVRQLRQLYAEASDFLKQARGTFWRERRVFSLWGAFEEADSRRQAADHTLQVLDRLHRELGGLQDTFLYQAVPRRAEIATTLRNTNILVNDQHYRQVAELWRLWIATGLAEEPTRQQIFALRQKICRDFDAFCALLTCRALDELGLHPADGAAPCRGGPALRLTTPTGEGIDLTWQEDGTLTLQRKTGCLLRLVPLPHTLTAASDADRLAHRCDVDRLTRLIAEVRTALAPCDTSSKATVSSGGVDTGNGSACVVLYPGTSLERNDLPAEWQLSLNTLGNDRLPGSGDRFGLLPVSPLAIDSLERLARAVRWWLTGESYLAYPPQAASGGRLPPEVLLPGNWLEVGAGSTHILVKRRPTTPEHEAWLLWLHGLRHPPRGARTTSVRIAPAILDALKVRVQDGVAQLAALQACPVCGGQGERLEPLDDGQFRCRCPECRSSWGVRVCGHCRSRYPFILLAAQIRPLRFKLTDKSLASLAGAGVPEELLSKLKALKDNEFESRDQFLRGLTESLDQDELTHCQDLVLTHADNRFEPGWVDRMLGRDVLAIPCWTEPREAFICPSCGVCGRANRGRISCVRCQQIQPQPT